MKQSPYRPPPQSEGAAQQNAAIAAEHERETFLVDDAPILSASCRL